MAPLLRRNFHASGIPRRRLQNATYRSYGTHAEAFTRLISRFTLNLNIPTTDISNKK